MGEAAGRPLLPRLVPLLPAVAFLATFGVFFVDKNREARTVLRSGRGLLAIGVLVGGYVLISFALRRVTRWLWVPPVVLAAAVLGLAAWAVRPYYVDETANRRLVTGPVDPPAGIASTVPTPASAPAPQPAQARRLGSGPIRGLDHDASGTISLIRAADGKLVIRFEQFDIEGVPDPRVYLVEGTDVQRPGGTSLGRLPGNRGQLLDIAVPAGVDAGPGWTVLVWCRAFSVPVANATQTAT